jgi:hypothetical protein
LVEWECSWHLKDLVTFGLSSAHWGLIEILLLLMICVILLNLVITILGVFELFLLIGSSR